MQEGRNICEKAEQRLRNSTINDDFDIYIYIYIYNIYNSKSLDVVQSLYFGSKLPSSERTNKAIQTTQNFSLQTKKGNNMGL